MPTVSGRVTNVLEYKHATKSGRVTIAGHPHDSEPVNNYSQPLLWRAFRRVAALRPEDELVI